MSKTMIKVDGKYLLREGDKIGFIRDEHIWDHNGEKIGYYRDDHVFDMGGHKVAFLQNNFICFNESSRRIRIEDNNREVVGGGLSDLERAAVRVLLGD